MSLEIRKLNADELPLFTELIRLFERVFDLKDFIIPPAEHLQSVLSQPGFWVMVALQDGQVVGGLTVHTIPQYYTSKPAAYLYDLAVDTRLHRQGIGQQLISATREICKQEGYLDLFVQTDRDAEQAVNFYRTTQPTREDEVLHFTYSM